MKSEKEKKPPNKNKHHNNHKKKNELLVYIYNVVEDEWATYLSAITDKQKRLYEVENCNSTAECYLFANSDEDEFIYVSPKKVSASFKKYFQNLVGAKKIEILVPSPEKKTGHICRDLFNDKTAFNALVKKARRYKKMVLVSYATSPQFLDLKERLTEKGVNVYAPEAPEVDCAWTVNFFGSKAGIRQLAQQSRAVEPDFIMPEGLICVGKLDAAKIAANKYIKQKGVVLKTNKGSGGNGVMIFRNGELPKEYKLCERKLYELLNQNDYWERFPIIIEDLINVNYAVGGGFPNIEFKIHKNGKIEMLYYCIMMVTKEGAYYGLDMHEDVINERTAARIIDTGYFIAEQYAASGYRGHFDIDMIAAKNNHIYVCESNTRNTGGTDVYKTARKLIGEDFFSDSYVLSRNRLELKVKRPPSFNKILTAVEPVLFSHRTKEGVVISSENTLKHKQVIYIVFGNTKRRAFDIEEKMKDLLSDLR
ncbi:MAG: hypothetical protein WC489_03595 [Patescibacteria group bacterium]